MDLNEYDIPCTWSTVSLSCLWLQAHLAWISRSTPGSISPPTDHSLTFDPRSIALEPTQTTSAPVWLQPTSLPVHRSWDVGTPVQPPTMQPVVQPIQINHSDELLSTLLSQTMLSGEPRLPKIGSSDRLNVFASSGDGWLRSIKSEDRLDRLVSVPSSSQLHTVGSDGWLRSIKSEDRLDRLLSVASSSQLHSVASDERFDSLLASCAGDASAAASAFVAPAAQMQSIFEDLEFNVMNTEASTPSGLFDMDSYLDDALSFRVPATTKPLNIIVNPASTETSAASTPSRFESQAAKRRNPARAAVANIRKVIDEFVPSDKSSSSSRVSKNKLALDKPRKRAYHRDVDIRLNDAELAQQVLGIDPGDYTSLSVSERNIVASARYRQKKLNRLGTLERIHHTLKIEYEELKSELSSIQAEISGIRSASSTALDQHMNPEFLD
eukprot:m.44409 g.44409  ORF g.44409 m.44409 type:complete len:439 (-) comp46982_c0_seq4:117-1433(-)